MRQVFCATMGLLVVLGPTLKTNAEQLLSLEEALKKVLGTTDVEKKDKSLPQNQVDEIKKQLKEESEHRILQESKLQIRPD